MKANLLPEPGTTLVLSNVRLGYFSTSKKSGERR